MGFYIEVGDKVKFVDVNNISLGENITEGKFYEVVELGILNKELYYFFISDDKNLPLVITREEYKYVKKVEKNLLRAKVVKAKSDKLF